MSGKKRSFLQSLFGSKNRACCSTRIEEIGPEEEKAGGGVSPEAKCCEASPDEKRDCGCGPGRCG